MVSKNLTSEDNQYATFYILDALCGIPLSKIQEINKPSEMTVVPQSPDYVLGVTNLRGNIITVIDAGKKLGLATQSTDEHTHHIIIHADGEYLGLLVGRIGNVVDVDPKYLDAPPPNLGEIPGRCFNAVYKSGEALIGLLSLKAFMD